MVSSHFLSAQFFEFNYLYNFKKDSLSKKNYAEIVSVLVNNNGRFYRAQNRIISDSIAYTKNIKYTHPNELINSTESYTSRVDNVTIEMDLNTMKKKKWIFTFDKAVANVDDLILPKWSLTNDTIHHQHRILKKAVTKYLNREWIAYYTEEIPMQIAPYTFYGLPGAIVLLEDQNKIFQFELINYKMKPNLDNFYETGISFRRKGDFEFLSSKELFKYGNILLNNSPQLLMNAGLQLEEEKVKKMEENHKKRKYIFLDPSLPFIL